MNRADSLANAAGKKALAVALFAMSAICGSGARAEPAIGQFELKDLEAEPGEIEFQSQNAWSFGQPRRRFATVAPGETVYDENSVTRQRHALEIEMSLATFFRMRVGIEYEKERFDEPATPALANGYEDLKLTEVALEGVIIVKPVPESGGFGFGMLTEFEHPTARGELNSISVGPIFGAKAGSWSALLNILFLKHFGSGEVTDDGLERDDKWDIGYAAQVKYELNATWSIALEGYGTFDRIGNSGMRSAGSIAFGDHDQHRAGPVVYREWRVGGRAKMSDKGDGRGNLVEAAGLERRGKSAAPKDDEGGSDGDEGTLYRLGTGVLFGLNDNTPDTTLKLSLEVEF